jgi:hypothetical protein
MKQLELSALDAVWSKALDAHLACVEAANGARVSLANAVVKAIECGEYLLEAKTIIGHGGFMRWFEANSQHVANFKHRTANHYMLLAQMPRERLQDVYTLRKAYIIAGCIDEPGNKRNATRLDPSGKSWISDLSDMAIHVVRWFDTRPLPDWSEMERAVFVERSKPVVQRWKEAAGERALDEFANL